MWKDLEKDGEVTKDELENQLKQIKDMKVQLDTSANAQVLAEQYHFNIHSVVNRPVQESVNQFLNDLDQDGDGQLSKEEYKPFWKSLRAQIGKPIPEDKFEAKFDKFWQKRHGDDGVVTSDELKGQIGFLKFKLGFNAIVGSKH